MDPLKVAIQYGGPFGGGLAVGLAVAFIVWRQLIKLQADVQTRSEALAIALNSIDKTLGFLVDTVKDGLGRRRRG